MLSMALAPLDAIHGPGGNVEAVKIHGHHDAEQIYVVQVVCLGRPPVINQERRYNIFLPSQLSFIGLTHMAVTDILSLIS